MKKIVISDKAPKALGPYSVAVESNGFIFCSGSLGLNPETGDLVDGGVEQQTVQCLTNLKHVLEAAGCEMADILKTTIFLVDMRDFPAVNSVYGSFFEGNFPARSTIGVASLPKGGMIEIEAIAVKK